MYSQKVDRDVYGDPRRDANNTSGAYASVLIPKSRRTKYIVPNPFSLASQFRLIYPNYSPSFNFAHCSGV